MYNLRCYCWQVAWLRVDTQTILTIHNHVITKNHRIGVTHSDHRTWMLHVREIRQADRGWYMCQINTDPMKSQVGFLDVVGQLNNTLDITTTNYCYPIFLTKLCELLNYGTNYEQQWYQLDLMDTVNGTALAHFLRSSSIINTTRVHCLLLLFVV